MKYFRGLELGGSEFVCVTNAFAKVKQMTEINTP